MRNDIRNNMAACLCDDAQVNKTKQKQGSNR